MAIAPNDSALQVFYGSVPLIGAILFTSWKENKRLDDLNKRIDDLQATLGKRIDDLNVALTKRIDDLQAMTSEGFKGVKERLGKLEDRVGDLEKATRIVR
jgi:tetrahydromethanopterin S-methyltransferase subunit G